MHASYLRNRVFDFIYLLIRVLNLYIRCKYSITVARDGRLSPANIWEHKRRT